MTAITIEIRNDSEIAQFYHMLSAGKRGATASVEETATKWRSKLADAYGGNIPKVLVFRGQDASVLIHLAENVQERDRQGTDNHLLADRIIRESGMKR